MKWLKRNSSPERKQKIRKALKASVWLLFVVGIIAVLGFAQSKHRQIPCESPQIYINQDTGHDFVTDQMVLERLRNVGYAFQGDQLCEVDLALVEQEVRKIPGVEQVDAYTYVNGNLQIDVQQRRPILRVINASGMSFYLDDKGYSMPISRRYAAKVPVVTGQFEEPLNLNAVDALESDSIGEISLLDEMFMLAKQIDENRFWQSQIVQIYVNQDQEFELIPRVGDQRIMFGNAESIEGKFQKLELFYKKGYADRLNQYDTLSVMYKGQIVCSKVN